MEAMSFEEATKGTVLNKFNISHLLLSGAIIALFILAFLMSLWFRNWVYFWFMVFQFAILLVIAFNNFPNEVFNSIFSEYPRWMVILGSLLAFFRVLAIIQFGRVYINTKKRFPKIHRSLAIALWGIFGMTVIGVFFRSFHFELGNLWFSIRQYPMAIFLGTILVCLIYIIRSKDTFGTIYSLGLFLPFAAIIFRLIEINVLDCLLYTSPSPRDR